MKHVIYLAFFISTAVFGQNQSVPKFSKQIDAMLDSMLTSFKSGNSKQAFIVLDSAIQLDSTNIGLYELKVSWEGYLKKYDQAVKTSLRLIRLVPNNPLTQFHTAIYYEKIGDSITAKQYYLKSIELFDKAIDTSSAETSDASVTANAGNGVLMWFLTKFSTS